MKSSRALRGLLALAVLMAMVLTTGAPVYAGTLTTASFTASTPYTYTSAVNTRYDYGFTTATTSTLSKVTMGVPAGTGGGNRYLSLPGINGNYASTPDSVANSVLGDIDLRAEVTLSNWALGTTQEVLTKAVGASQQSYQFYVLSNLLYLRTTSDGGTTNVVAWSTALPTSNGSTLWVRATRQVNNGSGGNATVFYTSADGITWTALGTPVVNSGTTSIYDSTTEVEVGSGFAGNNTLAGRVYYADARSGINGTTSSPSTCSATGVVACFNPVDATAAQAHAGSWTSSDSTAETWTVNRSGTNLPADIATDLTVSNITGLPTGGTANYRFIDGLATYNFTPTSVSSATPCTVSLQGFTNTATAGSYTSTIKTYDNSGPPPAVVDSVTTAALVFAADSSNTTTSVTIDPSFTFTVAPHSGACNGATQSGSSTATAAALGHVSFGTVATAAQDLTAASNSGGGFTVYLRSTASTANQVMADGNGHYIADASGTTGTPVAISAGTAAFGYTTTGGGVSYTSNSYAKVPTASGNDAVVTSASPSTTTGCVGYAVAVANTTPAASYTATIVYTAIPTF